MTAFALRHDPRPADVEAVRLIVASTGFFHPHEIDVAVELVRERLELGPASEYFFVLADDRAGQLVGYTCYGPIPCTTSSIDLYWIAVHARAQRQGLGLTLLKETERVVRAGIPGSRDPFQSPATGRRVYIETSGRPLYVPTQHFYQRAGYTLEAKLISFYAPGDDKLVFVKSLE